MLSAGTGKIGDGKIFVTTWSRSFVFVPAKPARKPFKGEG